MNQERGAVCAWRKKLNSQSGASILLALLILLLCVMVGASILMAASSNAGKSRSNQEEHQKYLALSSALRLVCGELEQAEYRGRYELEIEERTVTDNDGSDVVHTDYKFEQIDGVFTCGLKDTLPLLDELDSVCRGTFPESYDDAVLHYKYPKQEADPTFQDHSITLKVGTKDSAPIEGLDTDVTVTIRMDGDYTLYLTATLGEADTGYVYTMQARMTPTSAPPSFGAIPGVSPPTDESPDKGETEVLTWKLGWIAKREAGARE